MLRASKWVTKTNLFIALMVSALITGCVKEEDVLTEVSATSSGTTTVSASVNAGLYFQVQTAYETAEDVKFTQGTCSIPTGSASGTSTSCTIEIPEGDLHFSKVTFVTGTATPSSCKFLVFLPYVYKGGMVDNYTQPFLFEEGDVACATDPTASGCFNGPAIPISSYPEATGSYFMTAEGNEKAWDAVESGNLSGQVDNRWIANSLPVASRGANIGAGTTQEYVANTMRDYIIQCKDAYFETVYQITAVIDSIPGATNHYPDWND